MQSAILVVENEKIVALDIQGRLQRLGYRVVGTASSGEDALSCITASRPDLVLMDICLDSAMDGVEAAVMIRELHRIPIVFLTAYSDPELMHRVRMSEPYAYVLKPFEDPELHAAIEIALTRHQLEVKQKEAEQLLATTLNSIEDGVIVTSEDGKISFMNPVAEALTGWLQAEAVGADLRTVFVLDGESMLLSRGGIRRHIETRRNLMRDSAGNIMGFVHAFSNITEKIAQRAALQERDFEYRMLMEQAADAIILTDAGGKLLAVNSKACELTGYSREELLTMAIPDIVDPDQLPNDPIQLEDLNVGKWVSRERRFRRKDGSLIYVEIHGNSLADSRIQGIVRDITERKKTEAEFNRAVRSEVVDKIITKLHAFDHGENASMNLSRISLFVENIEGVDWGGGVSEPPADSPLQRFRYTVDEYSRVTAQQLVHVASLAAILEGDPSVRTTASKFNGASTRIRAAANSLQAALPATLTLLSGGLEQARSQNMDLLKRTVRTAVCEIRSCLSQLTNALMSDMTCDVPDILRITLNKFRCDTSSIMILYEDHASPLRAVIRGTDLDQVISTLIQNSIESLDATTDVEQKMVTTRLIPLNGKVRIEIEDNGTGIPRDHWGRIFDDHFSTKGDQRGFGLGYALHCLESCGGTLRHDPAGEKGARFIVELARA